MPPADVCVARRRGFVARTEMRRDASRRDVAMRSATARRRVLARVI